MGNDFQHVVATRYPEITRIVRGLTKFGANHAAMSGSGSAVFGLFARERDAENAADRLKERGRRVFVARTLNRARYQAAARVE